MRQSNEVGPWPTQTRRRSWSHPLSLGQCRIWFSEQLADGVPLYNESEAARLLGYLHVDAMERALNSAIARHETLRTTFQKGEEGPIAVVHASWTLRIKQIDLRDLQPVQRNAELQRLLIDEPSAPYQLNTAPGIRATLVRLGSDEHVLILMIHHLVCDWASIGQLWREFSTAYHAIVKGQRIATTPLLIQYGDYAIWEQQQITEGAFSEDLDYWENNLRGAPELLPLPTDRLRAQVRSYRGAKRRFWLGAKLTKAVRDLSRQEKTSPFTVFAAAFNTLLYRYTGSEDICIGIPVGERERPELQPLIAFLLHTQVLRTHLSGDLKFRDLLPVVQSGMLALYSHREVPFDEVVRRINPHRSVSQSPLFQVMLNWRDGDQQLSRIGMDGLKVELLLAEAGTSKFDLTMALTDDEDEVWLEAEYDTDLFDDDRILRMFGHYQTLLEAVAANPNRCLAELPLLTEPERLQLLVKWNATEIAYPSDLCIHQLFEQQAARAPDAIAVVFGKDEITYGELDRRSNQLAHYLAGLGVGPEVLVGICVERSVGMVVGLLGILKAGGAYVPLDPEYPRARLEFMVEDSRVTILLTQVPLLDLLPERRVQTVCLDRDWPQIARYSDHKLTTTVSSDNLAYVIYTSGSTGVPKGAMNTHGGIRNRLYWGQDRYRLSSSDSVLQKTPFSFDVSVWEFFWPLLNGARLVLARPGGHRDSGYLAELIHEQRITTVHFVPSMLRVFLEEAAASKCVSLKRVICSGEALPFDLQQKCFSRLKAELHNLYGPTEASVEVTYWACRFEHGRETVPIGRPIANTTIYVLDSRLNPVPIGLAGELCIGGVGLGRGYLNRPELTAERFIKNPYRQGKNERLYRTGDIARYRADGNIEHLGRTDDQVKVRGNRIELGEIEIALGRSKEVKQAVVVAREEEHGDKYLVAYVVSADREHTPSTSDLRNHLGLLLPVYMIPSAFVILETLPSLPNGKIDRKALPVPESNRTSSEVDYAAPATPVERTLVDIWQKVLGLKQVGVNHDFFALGGHSLQATLLLSEVHKIVGKRISLPAFFQHPTVLGMTRSLDEPKQGASDDRLIVLRTRNSPGTLFFLDAGIGLCRLAMLLEAGPSAVATAVPLRWSEMEPTAALPSLESIAAEHVALIRSYYRSGPCLLAGYSFGGVLAYEVAQQLQQEGIAVEVVLLLDTWAAEPVWWQKVKVRSLQLLGRLNVQRPITRTLKDGIERTTTATNPQRDQGSAGSDNLLFGEPPPSIIIKLLDRITEAYRFKPLDSHAMLFRCEQDRYSTNILNGKMGWEGLFTRGLEIIEIPGDHETLLQEPNLRELAKRVDESLGKMGCIVVPEPSPASLSLKGQV
jgi:amino acid adenylation domain-containing protein